ncbi:helix-turn-helix domain-containing protein [Pseudogulbenkiania sp. MAI-1]|uniref:helix-turn-helix domain-containing protein n=1 Tax=Pseudogulbenkiania sp. MAI-1 TaxID=990370 RepID=UPI00045EBE3F|nr:helix-turn-helix domain-containing protein [Pseudogulbenkiania sp. MAI-1]
MDERLSNKEAAIYLGIAEQTLHVWRCTKRYVIPYLKIGSKIYYRKRDLDRFLESRVVEG